MRSPRRLLPLLLPPVALLALVALLTGGPNRAFAEGDSPPPAGEPGMGADAPAPASDDDEDSDVPLALNERVEKAVKKGVQCLKQRQLPDGSWGVIDGGQPYGGGRLCLSVC